MKKKKLENMTATEVCGYIRDSIREMFGDAFENETDIWTSSGYYYVELPNKSLLTLRRWKIQDAIKKLGKK